ncbi:MAG: hypothetical protein JWM93_1052, partial [Frankiales bacterium]|nr:hypothetical protein [Frankiales bacterium]
MTAPARPDAVDFAPGESAASAVPALTAAALVVLGLVLAALGVVLMPVRPRVLGFGLPIAWAAACINFTAARLAQAAFARWWAPLLPFAGWALVVLPMSVFRPGGDRIFAFDDASLLYVVVGVLATAATVGTAAIPPAPAGIMPAAARP